MPTRRPFDITSPVWLWVEASAPEEDRLIGLLACWLMGVNANFVFRIIGVGESVYVWEYLHDDLGGVLLAYTDDDGEPLEPEDRYPLTRLRHFTMGRSRPLLEV